MIAIVGAGPVGLVLAKMLPGAIVFEKAPGINTNIKKAYALNRASISLLQEIGVFQQLAEPAPYTRMRVFDSQNISEVSFDALELDQACLGYIVQHSDLMSALCNVIEPARIRFNQEVQAIDDSFVTINGEALDVRLLIGADGARGITRQLAGISVNAKPYKQQSISVDVCANHQNTAWQIFHPEGPVAILPLASPEKASMVLSTNRASWWMSLNEDEFNLALAKHAPVPATLLGKPKCFELEYFNTQTYIGNNIALVGESAHRFHPLAGLGLNAGIADAIKLVQNLKSSRSLSSALKRYNRVARTSNQHLVWGMNAINDVFSSQRAPLQLARNYGLMCADKTLKLKKLLMQYAAGSHYEKNSFNRVS